MNEKLRNLQTTGQNFFFFIYKERITNWLLIIKREQFLILKTFLEDFVTGVSQRSN